MAWIALLLVACGGSSPQPVPSPTASPSPDLSALVVASGIRCADLTAVAMVSPHRVISGVYACADAKARDELTKFVDHDDNPAPIRSDADFQTFAALPPVFDQASFVITAPALDIATFRLSDSVSGHAVCLGVFLAGSAPSLGPDLRQVDFIAFRSLTSELC